MIVTRLIGGLGNQMFQYAAGCALALRHGTAVMIDRRGFEKYPLRAYALSNFALQAGDADPSLLPGAWRETALSRLVRRVGFSRKLRVYTERGFDFDPVVLDLPDGTYLDGYWQSERYFADLPDAIRAAFQLAEPFQPVRRVLADQIAGAGTSVSVHVRRGDYASDPATLAYHGTCSPEWYGQAMARMAEGLEQPFFFVFSDDPAWARANLPPHDRMVFVDPQPDGRDFEDMHLMASCRHHITANSSFSWWGAWLNPDRAKRVIVPARWFNQGPSNTDDLIPSTWTRL